MNETTSDMRVKATTVCRGCLSVSGEMKNMIDWDLAEIFYCVTNIRVYRSDEMSELLCMECEDSMMKSRDFRLQCQQSDVLLRDTIKNTIPVDKNNKVNTITYEMDDQKLTIHITAPDTEAKIKFLCPYNCEGSFIKKTDLLQHLIKLHSIQNDFAIDINYYCSYENCNYYKQSTKNKYFKGRKFLNQHYNKVHGSKINCDNCKMCFTSPNEYDRHLTTCNYTFLCQECNISYKTNERLLVHLMRKHPNLHSQYKAEKKAEKRKSDLIIDNKRAKLDEKLDYLIDSPKRSFATQTFENIKNDVALPSWNSDKSDPKTDEISTQTVFEDLLSLKSQTSEDEMFFPEAVSLSDIQTQTFPLEFGLSRLYKRTVTETLSPALSTQETQTCDCLYEPHLTSTETQTFNVDSFNSTQTQTCFDEELGETSL